MEIIGFILITLTIHASKLSHKEPTVVYHKLVGEWKKRKRKAETESGKLEMVSGTIDAFTRPAVQ